MPPMRTIVLPEAPRMMTWVRVDRQRQELVVGFGDGRTAFIPIEEIEKAGRPVKLDLGRISLPDPSVILIGNSEGGIEEIPWDLVRHFCDPAFSRSERERAQQSRRALGARLRRWREEAGLTQQALAEQAGVGRVTISRIERGERYARTETLQRIARALQIELVELIAPLEERAPQAVAV